ncbi:MAG TPA: cob(I)yrinic acid a,c-diamide adenosyltransferase [Longimicrobium sp.]|nr:cob(I)yrinic acid a,c-diamide adenosyltransferase [Longimicrobium sp.]
MTLKIYTRTGDGGETGLFGGQRVAKDDARVEAYGDVDELNSVLGIAVARLEAAGDAEMAGGLREVQADLFTLGARLATPAVEDGGRENRWIPLLDAGRVGEMEAWIDRAEAELDPLQNFVLPGGSDAAAALHLARTVCRRAERRVVTLTRVAHVDEAVIIYLNRLSDLIFTLARLANARAGITDVPWMPASR